MSGRSDDDDHADQAGPQSESVPAATPPAAEYEVGYKKPPREHQFQLGHKRGFRGGRSKGSRSLKDDLLDEVAERLNVKENGKDLRLTKQRAMVKAMVVKAIKGDERAAARVFTLLLQLGGNDPRETEAQTLSAEDQAIIDSFVRRNGGSDEPE